MWKELYSKPSKIDEIKSQLSEEVARRGKAGGKVDGVSDLSKLTEDEISSIYKNLQENPKGKLTPNTPEHKAQRWNDYKYKRGNDAWDFERWSKQYDANMRNYVHGTGREAKYREFFGGEKELYKTPYTYRDLDVVNHETLEIYEIKTGKEYLTTKGDLPNSERIIKDKWFVDQGYDVTWVLEQGGSQPLIDALTEAGIDIKYGKQIP